MFTCQFQFLHYLHVFRFSLYRPLVENGSARWCPPTSNVPRLLPSAGDRLQTPFQVAVLEALEPLVSFGFVVTIATQQP